jgi:hypothetical protein
MVGANWDWAYCMRDKLSFWVLVLGQFFYKKFIKMIF